MLKVLQPFISLALRSFFHAVDTMLHKRGQDNEVKTGFNFSLNCQGIDSNHRWKDGPEFYRSVSKTEDQKLVLYLGQLVREARLCSIRKETRGFLLSQAITRHHVNHETDEKPRNENLQ